MTTRSTTAFATLEAARDAAHAAHGPVAEARAALKRGHSMKRAAALTAALIAWDAALAVVYAAEVARDEAEALDAADAAEAEAAALAAAEPTFI